MSSRTDRDRKPSPQIRTTTSFHHARFLRRDTVYHVVSRTFQGRYLLRPCKRLNSIVLGVMGRGQELFPEVQCFAYAFLSNHFHLMLQGPPDQLASFIGFIKREISRRWGAHPNVKWQGTMWTRYWATALPTEDSQIQCFKYVLSQGAKEGLVASPLDWPGPHCAGPLSENSTPTGEWFNSTEYVRTRDIHTRCRRSGTIEKKDFCRSVSVDLQPIPVWLTFSSQQYRRKVCSLIREIEEERKRQHQRKPPLGTDQILQKPISTRKALAVVPWYERRRLICWASLTAPETQEYLRSYWQFQKAFRLASDTLRFEGAPSFPTGALWPPALRRIH